MLSSVQRDSPQQTRTYRPEAYIHMYTQCQLMLRTHLSKCESVSLKVIYYESCCYDQDANIHGFFEKQISPLNCKIFVGHVLHSKYENENSSSVLEIDEQKIYFFNVTIMFCLPRSHVSQIHSNKTIDFATNRFN